LDPWENQGAKDVNAHLKEAAVGILDEHTVEELPASVEEEIEHILEDG